MLYRLSPLEFQTETRYDIRKAEERLIDADNALNKNIITCGKLLEYIQAQAEYEEDIGNQFQSIIDQKEREVNALSKQSETYSSKIDEQRLIVSKAVEAYKEAAEEWLKKKEIELTLKIVSDLFALGFSIATPANALSVLKELGELVQMIQKAVNIINQVIQTYNDFKNRPSNLQKLIDMLKDLGEDDVDLPNALAWDEMKINMKLTLDAGPDIPAKEVVLDNFAIMVLRGKALLDCQNELLQKLSELAAAEARFNLHNRQKDCLNELKLKLDVLPDDLDSEAIDLVGSIGKLTVFERQMLIRRCGFCSHYSRSCSAV